MTQKWCEAEAETGEGGEEEGEGKVGKRRNFFGEFVFFFSLEKKNLIAARIPPLVC